MVATLVVSYLAYSSRSADDTRKAVVVLVHHWFHLVRNVVEIDSDGLLVEKVEALNANLGILGGGRSADLSTPPPCLWKVFILLAIAYVFLLFLLVLQRKDAIFLLFLIDLILDDSIEI